MICGAEACNLGAMIHGAELRVHFLKSFQKGSTCENLSQKGLKSKKDGHLLHSVGEVLNQLHLRRKKLLHVWIHCLIDRWGWCWILLIRDMCTDHRWHVLTSSGPGVYHLTIRKIIFQMVVLESMHKKLTQNEIAACSSARTDSVDLKDLCITFCVIIQ
jgi:hypothetical protein